MTKQSILFLCAMCAAACGGPAPKPQPAATTTPAPAPAKPAPGGSELAEGLGNVHHPIATTNPEAQKFFDQGVALTFGFNHEAAIRSFEKAQQLDPNAAMPYWGEAWALGTNYNMPVDDDREKLAFEKITEAKKQATTDVERGYVDAMAQRYSLDMKADRAALEKKYSAAMGELSRKYPDDLDAATLYAESMMNLNPWKLWSHDGKAAPGTDRIIAVLESVLKRDPSHLGANHFYIHAVEASPAPWRALPSAATLSTAAPASGHIVHMPAHIYAHVGDFASSAKANSGGATADEKYLAGAPPDSMYGLMYYSHNLMFLAADEMMQGRFAEAQRPVGILAKRLEGNPHVAMFPFIESVLSQPVSVLLRFNKTDELLALPAPPADKPVLIAWHHFARATALVRSGKADEAAKERALFAEAIPKVPKEAQWGGNGLSAAEAMTTAMLTLDARLAWAKGDHDKSIQLWRQAVAAQDRMPYDEPPDWYYPIRESLGAALLMADKPADAERIFRDDLDHNPRNPRSLFGLQAALSKQGKDADAAWVQRQFDAAWKGEKLTVEGL
jgi:tetratricopeptide (TPR) repeat protein